MVASTMITAATIPGRRTRASSMLAVIPVKTDSERTTSNPNRLGARMNVKPGTVAYNSRYNPAAGPKDVHNASRAMAAYTTVISRYFFHPAAMPMAPRPIATNPGNSTSFQRSSSFSSGRWTNAGDARYACQVAAKSRASSTERSNPVVRLSDAYAYISGTVSENATMAPMAIAIQYVRSVHQRRIVVTTSTA